MADLVETDIISPGGPGLGELAEHHQSRQWRNGANPPDICRGADALDQLRLESERQTFVAAAMIVRTHELVAGMADQHAARDQFEKAAAMMAAEAAPAHIGERMTVELLGIRRFAGFRRTAEVRNLDRAALEQDGRGHPLKQARRTRSSYRFLRRVPTSRNGASVGLEH